MTTNGQTFAFLLPEIILLVTATAIMVGSALARRRAIWTALGVAAFMSAGIVLYWQDRAFWKNPSLVTSFGEVSGPLFIDSLGHLMRWAALIIGLLFVFVASRAASNVLFGEYLGALMLVFVGLMLVSTAADLVLLFLAMELVSIPTYILLFLGRPDRDSMEATTKYFYLSILSSAVLLYGFSFLYGTAGTTQLAGIADHWATVGGGTSAAASLVPLVLILIVAGLGFKIAAVPFHFYAPDVYQGTTNANAGLLAIVPKIVGIVALVRILVMAAAAAAPFGWQLVLVISLVSMTLGNVCALRQRNIRRLLGYSSIAHAGYMLIGLAVALAVGQSPGGSAARDGVGAMLLYLAVYVVAALGTFAGLVYLGGEDGDVSQLGQLAGLGRSDPALAGAMAAFMFSLSGIPPLAGFWGKLTLFTGALSVGLDAPSQGPDGTEWFLVLAVVGVINAAIAAAYYLRIVGTLYFHGSEGEPKRAGGGGARGVAMVCAVAVVAIGLWPVWLIQLAHDATRSTRPRVISPASRALSGELEGDVVAELAPLRPVPPRP